MRTLIALLVLPLVSVVTPARAASRPVQLTVDATEAPRRILHVRELIPAAPGPLTLRYPKWIPGEHGPNGPIVDVAGIVIRAGGRTLEWRRDEVDLYALQVTVPAGADSVDVAFDYLAPAARDEYSSGGSTTAELLALEWNLTVMYPEHPGQRELTIVPKLTVPHGWKLGTALETQRQSGDTTEFKPVNLETLVDSPVVAGAWFRSFPLGTPDGIPHVLDVVADSEAALAIEPQHLEAVKRLVTEAGALFGARHYRRYHFLLTLSDKTAHFGLEHHQSSDNRVGERGLVNENLRKMWSSLLPHEFVHSWNGKYRRPAGLAVDGFDKPMHGDLLWVYEGLTNYLGWVLAARSGLAPTDWSREELAATAAQMATRAGRNWRPLVDTAVSAQLFKHHGSDWQGWRRATDYYPEGTLLWLDVDATLRAHSGGKKSLDDFCRAFHGGASNGAEVKPYTLDDVVKTLSAIDNSDWRKYFQEHVYAVAPSPPEGIAHAGWHLVYDETPNERLKAFGKEEKVLTLTYSLGISVKEDGAVADVLPGSPAAKAGLGPGMKLLGVNGHRYVHESFEDALKLSKTSRAPIELLVLNGESYRILKVDYHGGARYPHVQQDKGAADWMGALLKPLQTSTSPAK